MVRSGAVIELRFVFTGIQIRNISSMGLLLGLMDAGLWADLPEGARWTGDDRLRRKLNPHWVNWMEHCWIVGLYIGEGGYRVKEIARAALAPERNWQTVGLDMSGTVSLLFWNRFGHAADLPPPATRIKQLERHRTMLPQAVPITAGLPDGIFKLGLRSARFWIALTP